MATAARLATANTSHTHHRTTEPALRNTCRSLGCCCGENTAGGLHDQSAGRQAALTSPTVRPPGHGGSSTLVGEAGSPSGVHQAASGRLSGCSAGSWWVLIRSSSPARSLAVNFQLNGRAVWL